MQAPENKAAAPVLPPQGQGPHHPAVLRLSFTEFSLIVIAILLMNLHFILVISIRGVDTDVPESLAWISIINALNNWLVFLLPMIIPVEINYESRMTRFILGTVPPVGVLLSTYLSVFAVGVYIGAA